MKDPYDEWKVGKRPHIKGYFRDGTPFMHVSADDSITFVRAPYGLMPHGRWYHAYDGSELQFSMEFWLAEAASKYVLDADEDDFAKRIQPMVDLLNKLSDKKDIREGLTRSEKECLDVIFHNWKRAEAHIKREFTDVQRERRSNKNKASRMIRHLKQYEALYTAFDTYIQKKGNRIDKENAANLTKTLQNGYALVADFLMHESFLDKQVRAMMKAAYDKLVSFETDDKKRKKLRKELKQFLVTKD